MARRGIGTIVTSQVLRRTATHDFIGGSSGGIWRPNGSVALKKNRKPFRDIGKLLPLAEMKLTEKVKSN